MRKLFFPFLFFISVIVFPQTKQQQLTTQIDSLLNNEFFQSTQIAFEAYDLTTNKLLFSKNGKLLLTPASNLKILTTTTALEYLGFNYNFQTPISYTGEIINGMLYGNLYVTGGFDPDFTTNDLDTLALKVKQAGIKEISGKLIGDVSMMDSLFWGRGWMWDDDPSTDAPYLTPLDINKNSIGVIVKPSKIGEKPYTQLVPETNYFDIKNYAVTAPLDSPQTLTVDRNWIERKNTIILKGNVRNVSIPDSLIDTLRVNVYRPEKYFLSLFKEALNENGVKFTGKTLIDTTPDYAREIFTYKRPITEIIPNLNKQSYNLGAEMLIYALADKYFGKPATAENGIKMVDSLISKIEFDPEKFRIVDGSGVSHYNLITADLLLSVLKYVYYQKPEIFKMLYSSFPIAGVDGTLKKRMKGTPADGNVHAKTGTLSGVTSLSGYLTDKDGDLIAFSILIQNYVGSAKEGREIQDKICNILIDY